MAAFQCFVLLRKNFWLAIRDWKTTLFVALSPFAFVMLLWLLQLSFNYKVNQIGSFPDPAPVPRIPRCTKWGGKGCLTIAFTVADAESSGYFSGALSSYGTAVYNTTLAQNCTWSEIQDVGDESSCAAAQEPAGLAGLLGLKSKKRTAGGDLDATAAIHWERRQQAQQVLQYIATHNDPGPALELSNDTLVTPTFDSDTSAAAADDGIAADFHGDIAFFNSTDDLSNHLVQHKNQTQNDTDMHSWRLMYNNTATDDVSISVVRALEEALFHRIVGIPLDLEVAVGGYPKMPPRFLSSNIVQVAAAIFVYCPPMFVFLVLLNRIVAEKQRGLREIMRVMGLRDSMYWLSWFLSGIALQMLALTTFFIAGYITRFDLFVNVSFVANYLTFFLFGASMIPIAFICSTLVKTTQQATLVGFGVFALGFVLQVVLTAVPIYFWYDDDVPSFWRHLFEYYPPFNFARCLADFSLVAYPTVSSSGLEMESGPGYHFLDMFHSVYVSSMKVEAPPTYWSFLILLFDCALYCSVTWYCDNLTAVGGGLPPWFIFTPSYWGFLTVPSSKSRPDYYKDEVRLRAIAEEKRGRCIVVEKLRKVYRGQWWWKKNTAVDDMDLEIQQGTIFCLLGHNGAGKTTTLRMLSGLEKPTSGTAYIFGHHLQEDIKEIRKILGVCPQHDVLWDDLTAEQHIVLYALLRGVPSKELPTLIRRKLAQVNLYDVRKQQTKAFSGGMKRRLSVAISTIGEPKMVFLDEPTTGLDPISKRRVWQLVDEIKEGRVIILTTHSMEEADHLADVIGIMVHGKLKAVARPLVLKNEHGNGYCLNVVTKPDDAEVFADFVAAQFPEAALVTSNAGSSTFTIPLAELEKLTDFFEGLLQDPVTVDMVLDWGVSQSTLEEVFHNVTL